MMVDSKQIFNLPGSLSERPFYSPLVYFSKHIGKFPSFIISGTGINFQTIDELMGTGVMKEKPITSHAVISNSSPLNKGQVAHYSKLILYDHNVDHHTIDAFVAFVSSYDLCHGRARFIAFILDSFLIDRDIDLSITKFVTGISDVDGDLFPLKFYRRDLEENRTSFNKVIGVDTLGRIVCDGLLQYMMTGKAVLHVKGQNASDAVRYGLGFCKINEGVIYAVEIGELAIIECLRSLIPFSNLVESMSSQLASYPKPQMVGFMLEYFVGYALVANVNRNNTDIKNRIKSFSGSLLEYIESDSSHNEIFFPDHCCGPDVVYKHQRIFYMIQVKFVDKISKQERVNACHTTDPNYFYWNKKQNCVLKGFQKRRDEILIALGQFSCERFVFLHTTTKTIEGMDGVQVINETEEPNFFDEINLNMWKLLNVIRLKFNE